MTEGAWIPNDYIATILSWLSSLGSLHGPMTAGTIVVMPAFYNYRQKERKCPHFPVQEALHEKIRTLLVTPHWPERGRVRET